MKKYLAIVAILGAVAIASISMLANAEPKTEAVTTTVTTSSPAVAPSAATTTTTTITAPVSAEQVAKDTAECTAASSAAKADGAMPTDEEKAASLKTCLEGKGHAAAVSTEVTH